MKLIAEIEKAEKNGTLAEIGISNNFYWAYKRAVECDLKYIDFDGILWDRDIDLVMNDLKRYGIKTFTISNTSTGLMGNLTAFCERGCKISGMVTVKKYRHDDEVKSAIKLQMPR